MYILFWGKNVLGNSKNQEVIQSIQNLNIRTKTHSANTFDITSG